MDPMRVYRFMVDAARTSTNESPFYYERNKIPAEYRNRLFSYMTMKSIAENFGVSSPRVKEALGQLEYRGLLVTLRYDNGHPHTHIFPLERPYTDFPKLDNQHMHRLALSPWCFPEVLLSSHRAGDAFSVEEIALYLALYRYAENNEYSVMYELVGKIDSLADALDLPCEQVVDLLHKLSSRGMISFNFDETYHDIAIIKLS